MLEPIEALPDGVIGFEAVGQIQASDYVDVLLPAIDRAARDGKVRLVYVLGDRFDGYSAGAAWEDAKLGFKHWNDIERIAMVGDSRWEQGMATFAKPFTRAKVKYFDSSKLDDAKGWIAADE
jgi:hypothetical protein